MDNSKNKKKNKRDHNEKRWLKKAPKIKSYNNPPLTENHKTIRKAIDRYKNPRNIGGFDENKLSVATGITGAPKCKEAWKLQIKVTVRHQCVDCQMVWISKKQEPTCRGCGSVKLNISDFIE